MKKLLFLGAVSLLVFTGCKSEDDNEFGPIGIWKPSKYSRISGSNGATLSTENVSSCEKNSTYEFKSNNTATITLYELQSDNSCMNIGSESANWSYDPSTKILTYDGEQIPVQKITASEFVFEDPDSFYDYNGDGYADKTIVTLVK